MDGREYFNLYQVFVRISEWVLILICSLLIFSANVIPPLSTSVLLHTHMLIVYEDEQYVKNIKMSFCLHHLISQYGFLPQRQPKTQMRNDFFNLLL